MNKSALLVTPVATHPTASGDAQAILGYATMLIEEGWDLHIAFISINECDIAPMRRFWQDRLHVLSCRNPLVYGPIWRRMLHKFRSRLREMCGTRWPAWMGNYLLNDWYDPALEQKLKDLHTKYSFELLFVNYIFIAKSLTAFPGSVRKLFYAIDDFVNRNHRLRTTGADHWFSCSERSERKAYKWADVVLAIQDEERDRFARRSGGNVVTVSHRVKRMALPLTPSPRRRLLFVGSDIAINRDAVNHFLTQVWPQLVREFPEVRLKVIGKVARSFGHVSENNIELMGYVEDIRELYQWTDIVINPVRSGTGIAIKSLEALGYGRPLVAYASGWRGLTHFTKELNLKAETPCELGEICKQLMTRDDYYERVTLQISSLVARWNKRVEKNLRYVISGNINNHGIQDLV